MTNKSILRRVPGYREYVYHTRWITRKDAVDLVGLGLKGSLPGERPRKVQNLLVHAHRIRGEMMLRGGFHLPGGPRKRKRK